VELKSLNKVVLIGEAASKPTLRKTTKGISVCNFEIMTIRKWKGREGERNEEFMVHDCVVWDRLAEICVEMIDEGTRVYIEGRLGKHLFLNSEKKEVSETTITLNEMIIL